jgi:hypothetical protein
MCLAIRILKKNIMKKLLCIALMAFVGSVNAQEGQFNIGLNVGLPTGDAADISSLSLSAEANYLFEISDTFQAGASVAYLYNIGKDINFAGFTATLEDFSFLPIAAAGRFAASEKFTLGADVGYALGISPKGNDGGFYYRPMVGFHITEMMMIQASYSGVRGDGGSTFSNFSVGAMFSL